MILKHQLEQLIDSLIKRDKKHVETLYPSIEGRIELADSRAADALAATMLLAKYIMKKENENSTNKG